VFIELFTRNHKKISETVMNTHTKDPVRSVKFQKLHSTLQKAHLLFHCPCDGVSYYKYNYIESSK